MLIILDGMDNCGKTTVVNKLKDYFNDDIFTTGHDISRPIFNVIPTFGKIPYIDSHKKSPYWGDIAFKLCELEFLHSKKKVGIFDRSNLCNYVYPQIYGEDYHYCSAPQYVNEYILTRPEIYNAKNTYLLINSNYYHWCKVDDGKSFNSIHKSKLFHKKEVELFSAIPHYTRFTCNLIDLNGSYEIMDKLYDNLKEKIIKELRNG